MEEAEGAMCRSKGHCAVMGTASTMACMVESLGIALPGNASIPAADSRRKVFAHKSGMRIVDMVREDQKISQVLTKKAFENAIKVNAAIGGSTNFVIHMIAIAGRIGVDLTLADFDRCSMGIPLLTNVQPSGDYFVEDLYYAGGLPAVMKEMESYLHSDLITVSGKSVHDNISSAKSYNANVIATLEKPFKTETGLAVLRGNLSEGGCVIKPSAASKHLMKHRGKAVVFNDIEDYNRRIDSSDLEVDADSVLVLKMVGPKGYPGMPEVGKMSLPKKILEQGIHDMVRISDGRMSGTGYGTVVLHASPEAAVGGNFAMVQNGDYIALDVENRSLVLEVSDEELARRKAAWVAPKPITDRGYVAMYIRHVNQAHEGADLDFLVGKSSSEVTRDSH